MKESNNNKIISNLGREIKFGKKKKSQNLIRASWCLIRDVWMFVSSLCGSLRFYIIFSLKWKTVRNCVTAFFLCCTIIRETEDKLITLI